MKAAVAGFAIVLGAVGGIEFAMSVAIVIQCSILAVAGLALMWAGVDEIKSR